MTDSKEPVSERSDCCGAPVKDYMRWKWKCTKCGGFCALASAETEEKGHNSDITGHNSPDTEKEEAPSASEKRACLEMLWEKANYYCKDPNCDGSGDCLTGVAESAEEGEGLCMKCGKPAFSLDYIRSLESEREKLRAAMKRGQEMYEESRLEVIALKKKLEEMEKD